MCDSKDNGTIIPLAGEIPQELALVIERIMMPVLEPLVRMMKNNVEALDRLAASQKVQSDRMEAMEKQIRLNTLVTPQQVRYFNDAIKKRARELLSKHSYEDDQKACKTLSAMIRRAVLTRYGVSALHEVPKHEYPVVLSQVQTWNDALCIRDVLKKVREQGGGSSLDL